MHSVKLSLRTVFVRALCIGLLGLPSVYASASGDTSGCAGAYLLELNASLHSYGNGDVDFYEVDVDTARFLVVQVVAALDGSPEPKMILLGVLPGLPDHKSTEDPDPEPDPLGLKTLKSPGLVADLLYNLPLCRRSEVRVRDPAPGVESRIVTTLAPGWYFFSVEGAAGMAGEYRLCLDFLAW